MNPITLLVRYVATFLVVATLSLGNFAVGQSEDHEWPKCSRLLTRPMGSRIEIPADEVLHNGIDIPVFSDVHGNLEGLLRSLVNLQITTGQRFPIAFVTGDMGFFPDPAAINPVERHREFRNGTGLSLPDYFATDNLYQRFFVRGKGLSNLSTRIYFLRGNHEDQRLLRYLNSLYPGQAVSLDIHQTLFYLTDGARMDIAWGGSARASFGVLGGIDPSSRPKAAQRNPQITFDDEATYGLMDRVAAQGPLQVLLTHQGPAGMPSGHEDIATVCALLNVGLHLCGHGHAAAGPYREGITTSYQIRNLGHNSPVPTDDGRLLMLRVTADGAVQVLPPP